jgi:hypothetical protein
MRFYRTLFTVIFLTAGIFSFSCSRNSGSQGIVVRGEVKHELSLSTADLEKMPQLYFKDVPLIYEKSTDTREDKLLGVACYRGVLLRDILFRAGMKHTRKWEPGVFIRVTGMAGEEVVFSFGEIFYSSIGRSVIVALEKDDSRIRPVRGIGELVVATDLRAGRRISGVREISVGRPDVAMKAYDDRKKNIIRPATASCAVTDKKTGQSSTLGIDGLKNLPQISFSSALLIGECSGFRGIHSFDGVSLRAWLMSAGYNELNSDYKRFVLISSEDGFCATFSFGEIFNSRLGDNIMLATKKNGAPLGGEGFTMSVVREDSTGGRSVKRIHSIEIY